MFCLIMTMSETTVDQSDKMYVRIATNLPAPEIKNTNEIFSKIE